LLCPTAVAIHYNGNMSRKFLLSRKTVFVGIVNFGSVAHDDVMLSPKFP
jgi:hypothetical protein